jgi:hypothetical protein
MTAPETQPGNSRESEESNLARLLGEAFREIFPDTTVREEGSEIEVDPHLEDNSPLNPPHNRPQNPLGGPTEPQP